MLMCTTRFPDGESLSRKFAHCHPAVASRESARTFFLQKRTRNGRVFEPGKRAVFPENGRETCAAKLDLLGKKPLSAHSEVCHCVECLGTTHVALTCFSLRESPGPTRNRPRSTPFLRAHRRTHSRSRCRCVRLDFLVLLPEGSISGSHDRWAAGCDRLLVLP